MNGMKNGETVSASRPLQDFEQIRRYHITKGLSIEVLSLGIRLKDPRAARHTDIQGADGS